MPQCSYSIGRQGDIKLNDRLVSKYHARITIENGEIHIRDLDSCNGTYLIKNNRLIPILEVYVQINQRLFIGDQVYTVGELLDMAGGLQQAIEPTASRSTTNFGFAERTTEMRENQRRFSEERLSNPAYIEDPA